MANGVQAGSSVAAGLEGLVGGFLMGADFRRQRAFDKEDAEERRRLRERQQMLDRQAAEDRARVHAVQDLSLATEHGLAFGPRPKMSVEDLRRGTGEALKTFSGLEVPGARAEFVEGRQRRAELGIPEAPEGFHRVGPSAAERESGRLTRLREGVGGFLSADPEERSRMFSDPDIVAGLAELGILDEAAKPMFEGEQASELPFSVNVGGISTKAATPEEALAARERFTVPETPEPPDSGERFDQINALADDFAREAQIPMEVAAAVGRARAAGENAVGDQTRIVALQKLLDPGSVVRESEFNRLGQAGGLKGRAQFYYNKLNDEGRLPDFIREQLEEEMEAQAAVTARAFRPTIERFRQRAESFGLPPEQVIFDPFAAGSAGTNPFEDLIPGR